MGLASIEKGLLKKSSDKHKGIFYYINKKKKQGKSSSHVMSAAEYGRFKITLARAHAIAASRKKKKK